MARIKLLLLSGTVPVFNTVKTTVLSSLSLFSGGLSGESLELMGTFMIRRRSWIHEETTVRLTGLVSF